MRVKATFRVRSLCLADQCQWYVIWDLVPSFKYANVFLRLCRLMYGKSLTFPWSFYLFIINIPS